ncbi:MAG TPA: UbiD family decarboxylase [Methanofastidiosum sp.]|nr:UbiD family decarboxylase [Methanofastidiosum sp.]HQM95257.1 UbiD family decarboxylase [Methanofastidiosum sp.]HQQ48962.1 UbiD family decarboxylase [Methanofastidiosum sp.]
MELREFLSHEKDIIKIDRELEKFEMAKIVHENPAKILCFKDKGYDVYCNIWSTRDRVAKYLNLDKSNLLFSLKESMDKPTPYKVVSKAPFLDTEIKNFDLRKIPIQYHYPEDGGPYVTSGVVFVKDSKGNRNMSFHRMMVTGKDTFTIRIVPRHLFAMYNEAKAKGKDLEIVMAIGLPPYVLLPAAMSISYGINELEIANTLKKMGIGSELTAYRFGNGIDVPASSQFVFCGKILMEEGNEGPFVDITGTYDFVRKQPIVKIDKVYTAKDAFFHALMPGGYEHFLLMGMPREPIIYEGVSKVVPKVYGVRLTEGGNCWLHGVISIKKQKEGDGKNAIMAALASHPSMKRVVVVDEDIDIYNDTDVEWAIATRFQADKDLLIVNNAAGSSLDPSVKGDGTTAKMGIDATMPLKNNEGYKRAINFINK